MTDQHLSVGILRYPGSQRATVYGLTDLFVTANRFVDPAAADRNPTVQVSHWQWHARSKSMHSSYSSNGQDPEGLTVLIVPPSLDELPTESLHNGVLEWISGQHEIGTVVCSICKAAMILGRCGLLDGRTVTTHWALAEDFQNEFPATRLHSDQLVVDDGDIITSGGVMAWIDLALHIIDRFVGTTVMLEVARFFLVDPPGREQRFYKTFVARFDHGDESVLKAQRWMSKHMNEPFTQSEIAAVAAVSERTLVRRFQRIFDISPAAYLQNLRVSKARTLLELSGSSWNEISWSVGYEDPGSLRKVFKKTVGLTPAEYRQRFGRAASHRSAAS